MAINLDKEKKPDVDWQHFKCKDTHQNRDTWNGRSGLSPMKSSLPPTADVGIEQNKHVCKSAMHI
jgi:hypothetical protein